MFFQDPKLIIRGHKMKKILLTIILSTFLPALAVAEDKKMENTSGSASDLSMKGKHMSNTNVSQSDLNMKNKKHMSMGDNPFSSHDKKVATKSKSKSSQSYTVIKYKK